MSSWQSSVEPIGATTFDDPFTTSNISIGTSTIPILPTRSAMRPRLPMQDEACTHMTMTRLFAPNFACSKCRRLPSTGWLYRCTEDRELILEAEEERGTVERFDALVDVFGKAKKPFLRSPNARQDARQSFFDENSDSQLEQYSMEQILHILEQRRHALDVAQRANLGEFRALNARPGDFVPTIYPRSAFRPWLPIFGGECQFKVCSACSSHFRANAWMSINGIVNGEHPREAVYGTSFTMLGERPVSDVRHVANLGLRPNPDNVKKLVSTSNKPRHKPLPQLKRTPTMYPAEGLGIWSFQPETESQVVSSRRPPPPPPKDKPKHLSLNQKQLPMLPLEFPNFPPFPEPRTAPLPQTNDSFSPDIPYPPCPSLHRRRHTFPELSIVTSIPLPKQTIEEILTINRSTHLPLPTEVQRMDLAGFHNWKAAMAAAEEYRHLNTSSAAEEIDITDIPMSPALMTDMEVKEAMKGEGIGAFGAEPLQVVGGVALVEESVENHVADVLTQC